MNVLAQDMGYDNQLWFRVRLEVGGAIFTGWVRADLVVEAGNGCPAYQPVQQATPTRLYVEGAIEAPAPTSTVTPSPTITPTPTSPPQPVQPVTTCPKNMYHDSS